MCIEKINENREKLGYKPITGEKNIMELELLLPNATCLLTYKQWQKEGRQVKKGEKSFTLKGATIKKEKDGSEKTNYFRFNVFDISQTEPKKVEVE